MAKLFSTTCHLIRWLVCTGGGDSSLQVILANKSIAKIFWCSCMNMRLVCCRSQVCWKCEGEYCSIASWLVLSPDFASMCLNYGFCNIQPKTSSAAGTGRELQKQPVNNCRINTAS